jgi:hypothetical protein
LFRYTHPHELEEGQCCRDPIAIVVFVVITPKVVQSISKACVATVEYGIYFKSSHMMNIAYSSDNFAIGHVSAMRRSDGRYRTLFEYLYQSVDMKKLNTKELRATGPLPHAK